ncbi:LysR family transcriptional regulator [Vagococcus sp. BWB3-3]|uniref:LysR family transcriptional regulator n=1 Tax=Vagococcus allomyrinae TaxID=2794353 RepID=A0A940P6L1_9ENTE|nr:LysR family transcriptional regulator [Vagococcus allomyrinae]MBP1040696.1 LysR family transcriptional regulator [Vagococcus allomyrinae]
MNIQQLKYMDSIVKYGTINEAAKALFVAPSTISTAIKDLEEEIDLAIFLRSKRGMKPTEEGAEFIEYGRQVLAQLTLIEDTYVNRKSRKNRFSVSSQHYDFASEAFAKLIKESTSDSFSYRFLETDTKKVIEDVANNISEMGIVYISEFNSKVLYRLFERENLRSTSLLEFQPHVYVGKAHPLAKEKLVTYQQLSNYPAITFEQAEDSSHFSEEPLELQNHAKKVIVSDRTSAINILIGSDSYLTGSGIMSSSITRDVLFSIPIDSIQQHQIVWIQKQEGHLSALGNRYIELLESTLNDRTA